MEQLTANLDFAKVLRLLSLVIDLIEGYPLGHGHAVARFCQILAKTVGITINNPRLVPLIESALIHDLGKLQIKETILKKVSPLDKEELLSIWTHPLEGAKIAAIIKPLKDCSWFIRWHHENIDGSGYPDHLIADQIPLEAKILAISDAFISMLSERPYKHSQLPEEILTEISSYTNSKYDPKLIRLINRLSKEQYFKSLCTIVRGTSLKAISNILTSFPVLAFDTEANAYILPIFQIIANLIDSKSIYKKGHCTRVANLAVKVALQLQLSKEEVTFTYITALLHDIGMLEIDTAILEKQGRLTNKEFEVVRQHPGKASALLQLIPGFEQISNYCYTHHERFNGSGYPANLTEKQIPIISQIIAVCDSFDAMTSLRSYRKILPEDIAISEIRAFSGIQFEPEVVNALIKIKYNPRPYSLTGSQSPPPKGRDLERKGIR